MSKYLDYFRKHRNRIVKYQIAIICWRAAGESPEAGAKNLTGLGRKREALGLVSRFLRFRQKSQSQRLLRTHLISWNKYLFINFIGVSEIL
ncbi:hypothetical protein ZOSMA_12G00190 [Zostera marina]|uniref:Uncharacterized protein n=1 Tax=Zostera marina TaxID=29655 RepID=A0A0K9Q1J9_ZOSMR|nr:hypothetical protein ZOSMA_12G00190 [Zostera marina]